MKGVLLDGKIFIPEYSIIFINYEKKFVRLAEGFTIDYENIELIEYDANVEDFNWQIGVLYDRFNCGIIRSWGIFSYI